ncbi:DUF4810 domain-containing protein [Desulforhopalus sp. 52FAK]
MKNILLLIAIAFLFTGCAARKQPMYYFGDSSQALYAHKKEPTDESFMQMKQSLEDVIKHSELSGINIAPGTFANIGYLNLLENKPDQAIAYFNREKQLYPEATIFMDRMIQKVEAQIGEMSEEVEETAEKGETNAQN